MPLGPRSVFKPELEHPLELGCRRDLDLRPKEQQPRSTLLERQRPSPRVISLYAADPPDHSRTLLEAALDPLQTFVLGSAAGSYSLLTNLLVEVLVAR
jgi:hypothetical protein